MLMALLLSLLAGLATSIGGWLAVHRRFRSDSALSVMMAFAAGAMIFLSFVEIIPAAVEMLEDGSGIHLAELITYGAFAVGIVMVGLIDRFLPDTLNPSEVESNNKKTKHSKKSLQLLRSGYLVALVLAVHNFPEGMGTFIAANQDIQSGLVLAIAIAIHNVPEGIAVAAPVYAATKSRKKAFWWATLSGLTEPLGAVVAALLVALVIPMELQGAMLALVAGMMVFIAIDELMPAARRYQTRLHQPIYGFLLGVVVVAVSMILLRLG